jgi:hypothetical protein
MDRGAGRDGAVTEPKDIDEVLLILQADLPVLTKDKDGQVGNQKTKYADLAQANTHVLSRLNALGTTWVCTPDLLLPDYRFVLRYELKHVASGTVKGGMWPLKGDTPMQQGSAVTYARRYSLLAVTGVVAEGEDDDGDAASGRQYAQRAAQQSRRQRPAADPEEGGATAQRAAQRPRGARPPLPGEAEPDDKVGKDQHAHMHALWRELGADGDKHRDFRLKKIAEWTGLPDLDSSANLTRAQADTVITRLKERKANKVGGGEQ